MDFEQTTRCKAVTGVAGCLIAVLGAMAGSAVWLPYGRRGLFGDFEGETNQDLLWLGLPILVLAGTTAALAVFAAVRGRWRSALVLAAALAGLAALGYGFDVLAGPQATRHCAPSC
ncbi:hypothetical protein [Streptomyces sp. NPDC001568]|uniref:hypothetical protein n=1 Tax=Streptomyces sp. NPDC001568 TaxID=3364588 RepID=UPI0036AE082F